VRAMLPFKYLWLTTWNRAAAASAGSGRYPTSSIYADVGIDRPMPTRELCRHGDDRERRSLTAEGFWPWTATAGSA
jgi:hypothetical protein